ncbi:unnamed protein product [Meloidogyne enterolobii]|uniref:Uncharacterized protein n=3 Tax=Meloidogyne enterolobii TaxID=390850 RepID=A0A6V7XZW2_MELEN|nr:unnamed protein product [Meloidogyne enterolobii]
MFNYQILFLFQLLINYSTTNCFSLTESVATSTTIIPKNLSNFENITLGGENVTNIQQVLSNTNTSLTEDVEDDESSEPVEFLETMNGDNLVKGDKVIEVRTEWNTHVGDDDAEATE